ncbi:MAG TPA: glycosyltransferase family 39 protein [Candidatus Omnitrophota bacterium]|nr:glycosyltransferase family 39 protein [Candidatus Omnitrophota bacterium]
MENTKINTTQLKKHHSAWLLAAILLLALGIRLGTMNNHGVWIDETWVVTTPNFHLDSKDIFPKFFEYPQVKELAESKQALLKKVYNIHPVVQICFMLISDMHPPFYYIVSYFWTRHFGESLFAIRALPLLFGLLTIVCTYLIAKSLFGKKVALIAALFLAVSPMHVHFSQMARNFSLMTFLVTFSYLVLLTKLFKRFELKYAILYGISGFLALLTHYYSVFFIFTQIIMIILWEIKGKKRFLRWFVIFLLIALFYTPWLPAVYIQMFLRNPTTQSQLTSTNLNTVLSQMYAVGFIPSVTTKFFSGAVVNFLKIINLVVIVFLVFCGGNKLKAHDRMAFRWILVWCGMPIFLLSCLSLLKPLYSIKSLLPILPAFFILYAFVLARLKNKVLLSFILVCLSSIMLISQLVWPTYPGIESTEDTRGAVAQLKSSISSEDIVAVQPGFYRDGLWYYLPRDCMLLDEDQTILIPRDKNIWLFRFWDRNKSIPEIEHANPDSTYKFFGVSAYLWKKSSL